MAGLAMRIGVITNPHSRKNRNRPNRKNDLQKLVGNLGEVYATSSIADIKPIVREFFRSGKDVWVADGGDGAFHWLVRSGIEVLQESEFADRKLPCIVPANGGTIDFVASNAGVTGLAEEIVTYLAAAAAADSDLPWVEVDSMQIATTSVVDGKVTNDVTWGFGSAVGGVGQRFFSKYYSHGDPNPKTIVKVVGTTLASMPIALSPLRNIPGIPDELRTYARDMFKPARCRISLDGMVLPFEEYTGIHISSMSLDLGGVFRFFPKADKPGYMQVLVGKPSPLGIVRNLPRMHFGKKLAGDDIVDRLCRKMTVEVTGDELLDPIIDGESYQKISKLEFSQGPRIRILQVPAATSRFARAA